MLKRPGRLFLALSLVILVLDQVAKWVVRSNMLEGRSIPLVPGALNLLFVQNVGAAFGLLPGFQPVFIATSVFVLLIVAGFWFKTRPSHPLVVVALALVSAGALGNLIDRAVLGSVTDFLEFAFVEFPVFNIADMAIVSGVALLALWIVFLMPDETPVDARTESLSEATAVPPADTDPSL
ncbi:MAG: signal peptidase II [Coriobacteriia bacterium]|nr:signal peptidase II [Coriobacteriia bacterium]